MKFEDFTKEERTTIAEFFYSYDSDILIKEDALELSKLFLDKSFIDLDHFSNINERIINDKEVLEEMLEILFTSVEDEEGKKIKWMNILEEVIQKTSNK